jgi:hypothetical protein
MKQEHRQQEIMQIEYGDFLEKCLRQTHEYFKVNRLFLEFTTKQMDCFDCFIRQKVPFLAFLIDQYYKNKKIVSLQLIKLGDQKFIDHLDELILQYLKTSNRKILSEAKALYIGMIQAALIKRSI